MNEPTKENIRAVTDSLKTFLDEINQKKGGLNLINFVNQMEKVFAEQGYRTPTKLPDKPNILLIHDTSAGDLILMSGVIREIRRVYPNAHIMLLCSYVAQNLVECCPYVNQIFIHDDGEQCKVPVDNFNWCVSQAERFLDRRIDICYSFTHFPPASLVMFMCGAKQRISYQFKNEYAKSKFHPFAIPEAYTILATESVPLFLYGDHHADSNFALLDHKLGMPVANRTAELWCSKEDIDVAKKFLQGKSEKIYALNMGGTGLCKHYPPEKYAELVKMILEEDSEVNFIILGGGIMDRESSETFRQALGEELFDSKVIDATSKLTYRQSGAACTLAKLFIGNDTGTMHAAAAVGCPVILVSAFPADLPKNIFDTVRAYRPYNVPCVIVQPAHALPECAENSPYTQYGCQKTHEQHCITQIEPQKIFQALHLLNERVAEGNRRPLYIC